MIHYKFVVEQMKEFSERSLEELLDELKIISDNTKIYTRELNILKTRKDGYGINKGDYTIDKDDAGDLRMFFCGVNVKLKDMGSLSSMQKYFPNGMSPRVLIKFRLFSNEVEQIEELWNSNEKTRLALLSKIRNEIDKQNLESPRDIKKIPDSKELTHEKGYSQKNKKSINYQIFYKKYILANLILYDKFNRFPFQYEISKHTCYSESSLSRVLNSKHHLSAIVIEIISCKKSCKLSDIRLSEHQVEILSKLSEMISRTKYSVLNPTITKNIKNY